MLAHAFELSGLHSQRCILEMHAECKTIKCLVVGKVIRAECVSKYCLSAIKRLFEVILKFRTNFMTPLPQVWRHPQASITAGIMVYLRA